MTFDYEKMEADRAAGTKGDWDAVADETAAQVKGFPCIYAKDYIVVGTEGMYGDIDVDFANARRIARVPDMEAEIIRLRNHLRIILDSKDLPASEGYFKQAVINEARAALKGDNQ